MMIGPESSRALHKSVDVLHVTECFEGGVGRAIVNLVRATPHLRHGLIARGADLEDTSRIEDFEIVLRLGPDALRHVINVRRATVELQPRIIHAHSSWAGVYTRAFIRQGPDLIYQPHGYAFEKPNKIISLFYRQMEKILAKRGKQ